MVAKRGRDEEVAGRTSLPYDVFAGPQVDLTISSRVPKVPGEYVVEIELVSELVTLFEKVGTPRLRLAARVESGREAAAR